MGVGVGMGIVAVSSILFPFPLSLDPLPPQAASMASAMPLTVILIEVFIEFSPYRFPTQLVLGRSLKFLVPFGSR